MPVDSNIRPPINPVQPGAYSAVDASGLAGAGAATAPVLAILGAVAGGIPNVLMKFRDPQALKNRLRSGAAYDSARFAMAIGANPLYIMRVGSGILQSTKALQNAGAAAVVTLTSLDYGAWTTGITVQVAANNLVTVRYTDSNGVTYTENYPCGAAATAQQIADCINGKTVGFSPSQYVSAAANAGAAPLAVLAATALAGGSDGTGASGLQAGDWTTALSALEGENVDVIVVATGDATIHAQVQAHCIAMSLPLARKERVSVNGGVLGETVAAQVTRMAALNDKRSQLAFPGCQDFDDKGVLKTWDPFVTAAKIAAMHVTQPDSATSLLHQLVPCVDLEQVGGRYLSTAQGSDVDTLLRANVSPLTPAPGGGFWLVDSLSGWTTDDSFRDFHKTRSADAVQRRLRTRLEAKYVGKKSLNLTANTLTDDATAEAQGLKDETVIRDFGQVTVTPGADTRSYNVTVAVLLVDAVKFIFITVALQSAAPLSTQQPVADSALL